MRTKNNKREAIILICAAVITLAASACGKKTSSSSSNSFYPGYSYGTTPPAATISITDAATCSYYGGAWVGGNTCKFVIPYLIMGSWSGYYWLAGAPNIPSVPLVRPNAPTELDQAGWLTYPVEAGDKITFNGDPRLGSVNFWNFFSGDGCKDDQGAITMVLSDQSQTYVLANNVQTQILNAGYIAFGFDKSRKSDWSDNCVEANNNIAININVSHCVQGTTTVVCP